MALPTMRNRSIRRYRPDFQEEVNRLFGDFFNLPAYQLAQWAPAADMVETEDHYRVELDAPGYSSDDIEVTLEQGILTISGERAEEKEETRGTYHLRERSTGRFSRSFSMPRSVDAEKLSARLEDGILVVELPKAPEAKARRIEVKIK